MTLCRPRDHFPGGFVYEATMRGAPGGKGRTQVARIRALIFNHVIDWPMIGDR